MRKFLLMLAIMGSVVTTASAENKRMNAEMDFVFIVFRGWCGNAHVEGKFDHDPSFWETAHYRMAANIACDMMSGF